MDITFDFSQFMTSGDSNCDLTPLSDEWSDLRASRQATR